MEFPGLGTLINTLTIIGGAALGVLVGSRVSEKLRNLVTDILGLVTLLAAASALIPLWSADYVSALPKGWTLLCVLGSLLIGALIGSALHLEEKLEVLGENLRKRFRASKESPFIEGFVSDGMGTGIDQLILKSTLDFFAAMAFATSLGWGVAASAIPVGIYQGAWTLVGLGLGSILSIYQIAAMTIVGGLMLLCIALRLLKIKEVAVANLLPALAIAPLFALVMHQFV